LQTVQPAVRTAGLDADLAALLQQTAPAAAPKAPAAVGELDAISRYIAQQSKPQTRGGLFD
jgi:hypothetical protein